MSDPLKNRRFAVILHQIIHLPGVLQPTPALSCSISSFNRRIAENTSHHSEKNR